MIILDTHIWVWWMQGDTRLSSGAQTILSVAETEGVAVSAISCWEVAKLVEYGRLQLPCPVLAWLDAALSRPSVHLLPLTPQICVASTTLPGNFHHDPADQMIVATARVLDIPLLTVDAKILAYPHVRLAQ